MAEGDLGQALRKQLQALLDGGQAHATFDDAVKDFPVKLRGVVPEGLPYSAWQILEHIRLAQRDILDFTGIPMAPTRNTNGRRTIGRRLRRREWRRGRIRSPQIREDRKAFEKLLKSADDVELVKPFAWGEGQNLLREALLLADHDAYHVGELIVVRRLVGAWKK